MKSWLLESDIEMYKKGKKGRSVAKKSIRTLSAKIYQNITSVSKNVYIDKLDEIVKKYHDKHYRTIKIKPADIKGDTYINFDADKNNKNPVFKVGDHVMISKFKNTKLYTPN